MPTRYADRLGEGGLRCLLEEGIQYNNAHHAHANTETIVGHVTLATGAHPAAHGMIGNIWFDRRTGVKTYNIEDRDHHLLTEGADVDADTEIDPTQKAATSGDRSPTAILTTPFSDELASLTAGRAKLFGVSIDQSTVSEQEQRPRQHEQERRRVRRHLLRPQRAGRTGSQLDSNGSGQGLVLSVALLQPDGGVLRQELAAR